jgi:hypothetical protein
LHARFPRSRKPGRKPSIVGQDGILRPICNRPRPSETFPSGPFPVLGNAMWSQFSDGRST